MPSASFLFWNKVWPPADPQLSFKGRTILITGANTGLGYAIAVKVIEKGCTDVILGVRSMEKGEAAKARMIDWTGCSPSAIRLWEIDQKSFASVQAFAKRASTLSKLDIVILNAGVMRAGHHMTADGWEEMVQVNALSTSLLGILLLPKLVETAKADERHLPHMCFVSSTGVLVGDRERLKTEKSALKTVSLEKNFPFSPPNLGLRQYELTKLIGEYAKIGIADLPLLRSKDGRPSVIVNSGYSGSCFSEISRERIGDSAVKQYISSLMLRSAEQGARNIVKAAALGEDSHGKWWWNDKLAEYEVLLDPHLLGHRR